MCCGKRREGGGEEIGEVGVHGEAKRCVGEGRDMGLLGQGGGVW